MNEHATIPSPGTVRLERLLPGPIARVWEFLTIPEKRARWLAGGPMELVPGGALTLHFLHADLSHEKELPAAYRALKHGHSLPGRVLECEAPRLLAFTWGDGGDSPPSQVRFELAEEGSMVRLIITHGGLGGREGQINVAGGWEAHCGILEDILAARPPRGFWTAHEAADRHHRQGMG